MATITKFDLTYRKNDNKPLFASFENKELMNVSKLQNYIPLYTTFFSINSTNYNTINLNQQFNVKTIDTKIGYNIYEGILTEQQDNKEKKAKLFFKYSPLLDPIKYLQGKYETLNALHLPSFFPLADASAASPKINDPNNSAYVDSFFTYLTSKLLHTHAFLHGIDFYGSFIGIKHDYKCDVQDDIDYLYDSTFFHKNNEVLYSIENSDIAAHIFNKDSRKCKQKPIAILEDNDNVLMDDIIQLNDIMDISNLNDLPSVTLLEEVSSLRETVIDTTHLKRSSSSSSAKFSVSSSCSSRSSNTEDELDEDYEDDEEEEEDTEDGEEGDEDGEESEEGEEEESIIVQIKDFPVHIIGLECCENTLDALISENELNDDEWDSIVLQILMILITYQKAFQLTHNDLHTNNVMYNKTDKDFLYYKINDKYYKVPTYGRIFKIIDFGRAIYKFKGQLICSDSFHTKEGDAATQYNCEPYYNAKKPEILPNFSFDLCRLGCSIFDFIVEEDEDDIRIEKIKSPILRMIAGWCKDDKGRNILYKLNGDERYPDFKLYKMIARKVHQHIPLTVLQDTYFSKYFLDNKKIVKTKIKEGKMIDIDAIPDYTPF